MTELPPYVSGQWPVLGHAVEFLRQPLRLLERGHREHGGIFSLRLRGSSAVVLLGPEHSRFFFSETDRRLSLREAYPFFKRMFDPEFYNFAEFEEYRRQRELVLPRFQGRQLDGYVEVMERETADLMAKLDERGEFDLVATLGPLVMRIAARSFFGPQFSQRLGGESFAEFRRFSEGMSPLLSISKIPHQIRSRRSRDRLRVTLGGMIRERRANPVDPPDFLQMLSMARFADGEPVPDLVLINLVLMLTWAGHETTTGHVSWAMIDLLQHPPELERLRDELAQLDPTQPLSLSELNKLSHLDRALHETERLHPVAYLIMRNAAETFDYAGYTIPKGSRVLIAPWTSHRLADAYPDPHRFWPDRFVEDPKGMRTLIGFGGGIHRCLGVHFAYLEMKVILAHLLREYEFELIDQDPQPIAGSKTKWPASPCRVRYQRRTRVKRLSQLAVSA